jgi:protocatechuate 3,4-dioxygenase alpha subunit
VTGPATGGRPRTAGQTIGPFFGFSLPYPDGPQLVEPGAAGAIRLHGLVLDGAGEPVPDALLELWQPDSDGNVVRSSGSLRRDGWTFTGWGRAATDASGHYSFTTVTPGRRDGRPAFFALTVFARGLLDRLFTRAYLPADDATLTADPALARLDRDRRRTLVARTDGPGFVFDVRLQGPDETVFFEFTAAERPPG